MKPQAAGQTGNRKSKLLNFDNRKSRTTETESLVQEHEANKKKRSSAVRHLSCLLCITITRTDRRKIKMNENIEILQRQFDAYCTKVLKYASISYYHANRRRMEHEVSFSSLLEKDLAEVSTTDRYPCMLYRFQVREWLVEVQSEPLGHAIERLTPYRQEIILLYFFLGFKNKEIAALYGCNAGKISYHKMRAVRQIRSEMEVRRHE